MSSFGIPLIDEKVQEAGHVLLMHEPGTESTPFVSQAVQLNLEAGRPVVYVAMDHPVLRVKENLAAHGVSFDVQDRIHFVDAWSPRMGSSPQATHLLSDLSDLVALAKILGRLADEHPGSVLVLESLSTILNEGGPAQVDAGRETLFAALAGFKHVVAVFTDWGYEEDISWLTKGFPGRVVLHGVKERVVTDHYFLAHGPKGDAGPVPYRRSKDGSVQGYVPKICVVGPQGAGKSSLIRAISMTTVGTESGKTTVAGELGHLDRRGLSLELFGTPGHQRFEALLEVIARQSTGVVLVVDSTAPETFKRADKILQKVWKQNLPVVVAANKQDIPGALAPDMLVKRLSLPGDYPVVGCSTSDRDSVENVLDTLIDRIFNRGDDA